MRPSGRAQYSDAAGPYFNAWDIAMTREIRAAVRRRIARRDILTRVALIAAVVLAVVLTAVYWLGEDTWDMARNRSTSVTSSATGTWRDRVVIPAAAPRSSGRTILIMKELRKGLSM